MHKRILLVLFAIGVPAGAWFWFFGRDQTTVLRLATGGVTGTYHRLGQAIKACVEEEFPDLVIELQTSRGALENLRLLRTGQVDMAFVQNDTPGEPEVTSLLPAHKEVLHLIVNSDSIQSVAELRGKRVAVGPEQSGTERLVQRLLQHYNLVYDDFIPIYASTQAAHQLFRAGQLDAVFAVSGLNSASCQRLLDVPGSELLGLEELGQQGGPVDGFSLVYPYVQPYVVPRLVYGEKPHTAISTIAVRAVLVAHRDLDTTLAYNITGTLFRHRAALVASDLNAMQISEQFDATHLQFPLHDGAKAYYERDEPGFLVRYAESMGFILSVLVTVFACATAVHESVKRKKKNRIDLYYTRINEILNLLSRQDLSNQDLCGFQIELREMRSRAFDELVREKLLADESFAIFQTVLGQCLTELDLQLQKVPAEEMNSLRERELPGARLRVTRRFASSATIKTMDGQV